MATSFVNNFVKGSPYYFEIEDCLTQFVAAFNDVVIERYNKNREPASRLHVRFTYAPKQRALHDIVNKSQHFTVPVISVVPNGVSRDSKRVFNKLEGSFHSSVDPGAVEDMLQPVPVNIGVNMSIIAKSQDDMNQILSNFVPYCDPYIVISWKVPEEYSSKGREIRSEVLWDETISIQYPYELGPTDPYRIIADTSFTIKSWLFKDHGNNYSGTILEVNASMHDSLEFLDDLDD